MNSRFHYRAFGLHIDSEIELPELPSIPLREDKTEVTIRRGSVPRPNRRATHNEERAVSVLGAAFLIRNGNEITVECVPQADPVAIRVVLLGRVMAFLLRQRGWLPLHASGVVIDNECVLFLGAVGAGKSTTAAAFHAQGHLVITDDVAAVRTNNDEGRCVVQASRSFVRLHDDARVVLGNCDLPAAFQLDKHRYDLNTGTAPQELYPVACAYILEYGDAMRVEPVPSLQAIALLSRHSFVRHRIMEREVLRRHLRDCSAMAGVVSVRRLVRPRSLDALPAVVRFVEDDLAALKGNRELPVVRA